MDSHHGVEKRGLSDTVGFKAELEVSPRSIKGPRATRFRQFQACFVGTEKHLFVQAALTVLVVDGERMLTDRFSLYDPDNFAALDAANLRVFFDIFQFDHSTSPHSMVDITAWSLVWTWSVDGDLKPGAMTRFSTP